MWAVEVTGVHAKRLWKALEGTMKVLKSIVLWHKRQVTY